MTTWVYDDGGRAAAGFRGVTGDCVVRAVAIATQLPYQRVYDDLNALGLAAWEGRSARQRGHDARSSRRRSQSRTGVERAVYEPYLAHLGFRWTPTMSIGAGTTVHLRADELLPGRLVVAVSGHLVAVVDGVVHDLDDPSRGGTRCVYGYYRREP